MTVPWHLKHAVHGDKPRAVQAEAIRQQGGKKKFGHWLEQGLGKTALGLNQFIDSDDTEIGIVVCPNSLKLDWTLAPAEWGVPWMPVGYWPRDPLPSDQSYMLYSINYEAVREKDTLKVLIKLFERRSCYLIIDESTSIKNPQTSTFRAVIELAKRAPELVELNGTPLTQDVRDYYGQLRVLGRLNGMEAVVFKNRFAEMGGYFNRECVGVRNEEELGRILNSCTFRALKKDWRKDLPPKIYKTTHLEMSKRQRQHYAEMMEEFFTVIEGEEISADMVIAQMGKLRQISSCVVLNHGKEIFFEQPKDNPKLQAALQIAGTTPGKVIISYHHRACGAMLYEAFSKAKLCPAWIKGGMKPEHIVEQKRMFNEGPRCRVLIGQQSATARGHTLMGGEGLDRCSTMVFFENDFSYYWRSQMEDRNYGRDEKDQGTVVYDLVCSPMDQITVDALTGKKDLAAKMDEIVKLVRER